MLLLLRDEFVALVLALGTMGGWTGTAAEPGVLLMTVPRFLNAGGRLVGGGMRYRTGAARLERMRLATSSLRPFLETVKIQARISRSTLLRTVSA